MSTLKVNAITNVAGNADVTNVGKVLQTVQTFKGDTTTTTSNSFSDITGMAATITPSHLIVIKF